MTGRFSGSHHPQQPAGEMSAKEMLEYVRSADRVNELLELFETKRTEADEYAKAVRDSVAHLHEKAEAEILANRARTTEIYQNEIRVANKNASETVASAQQRSEQILAAANAEDQRIRAAASAALENANKLQADAQNAHAEAQRVLQDAQIEAANTRAEAKAVLARALQVTQDLDQS